MADGPPFRYITDAREAEVALEGLRGAALVGLDTETYWDAGVSRSRVSLVQLGQPGGEISVIDVSAAGVEPVRALVEEPAVRMVAHNARFDQGVLRGESLSPASFIDTLSLARSALVLSSYSLASVNEHLFGMPLDKTLQSSNWRRRPLTRAQLEYAAKDVRVTLMVYEELKRRLEDEGRWEDALRRALIPDEPSAAKPKRIRRPVAPSPPLTAEEKRAVASLKNWRLGRANLQRVPAYMICPDKTLECLARERPATVEALRSIYGLGDSKISSFGEDLLAALGKALS